MADKAAEAVKFRNAVRAGDLAGVREMLKNGVDFAGKAKTHGEWTPLHTACWGSAKPQNDREIVEAILMAAQKAGKKSEEEVRNYKDAKYGLTAAELATERKDALEAAATGDEKALDEKRRRG